MWAWWTASAASASSSAADLGVVLVGRQSLGEAAARDQLHGEVLLAVVLADLVDRHDAGVVEQGDGLGLVLEPAQLVVAGEHAGLDHLEGDGPVEADLPGLVDDAHAAAAQLLVDLVVAEVADAGGLGTDLPVPRCRRRRSGRSRRDRMSARHPRPSV